MTNRQFKKRYKNPIGRVMHSLKTAPELLKLWSGMHPGNRTQFPTTFIGTVQRTKQILKALVILK